MHNKKPWRTIRFTGVYCLNIVKPGPLRWNTDITAFENSSHAVNSGPCPMSVQN